MVSNVEKGELTFQIRRGEQVIAHVPLWNFPGGAQLRECYETESEIIVLGEPEDDDHDCDIMGCSTCFHVRHRYKK